MQMEHQTDSIRYLNQLNTVRQLDVISSRRAHPFDAQWLEAFVQHGTSQIEGVAAGVQQLCKELGPVTELHDAPPGTEAGEGEDDEEGDGECAHPGGGSLLSDVRRLLVQNQERERHSADMHAAVTGLVAAVQEDMRRNAEARSAMCTYFD